ncbi:MAG TPA: TetR/AcrR family transcriptional regulator [Myxococcales bacterium]|jgi:AcrR family transcriptional regulator|nr:TetR/AcrR family transcriptional regulator [Myxococcales bacterium]
MPKRPADLRRAILDASLALASEGGVGALSMREVARRAHVTHGAPYHHFKDRSAILAALAAEGFALLTKEMLSAMKDEDRGSVARFEACGRGYFRFALRHPAHMKLMFRPELANPTEHPEVDQAACASMQVLVDCVIECQKAGNAPAGDPMPLVVTSWSTVHGLAALWLDGPLCRMKGFAASPQELARRVAHTLGELLSTKP